RRHRVAARRFENHAVLLNLFCRLRPPAVRIAVAAKCGAIQLRDYSRCKKLLADSAPLFLCDLIQVTGAWRDSWCRIGLVRVQLPLAGIARSIFRLVGVGGGPG